MWEFSVWINGDLDLGLDKNILAKLINSSTGQCWSSQSYNPCPGIVSNVASKESQTIIPLTEQTTKIYRKICSNGLNRKDFSVVYKYLHNLKN